MGTVIGRMDLTPKQRLDEWLTMVMLRESLKFMYKKNTKGKFDIAIKKETSLYNEYLTDYSVAA